MERHKIFSKQLPQTIGTKVVPEIPGKNSIFWLRRLPLKIHPEK
jgi:hypothetical protein